MKKLLLGLVLTNLISFSTFACPDLNGSYAVEYGKMRMNSSMQKNNDGVYILNNEERDVILDGQNHALSEGMSYSAACSSDTVTIHILAGNQSVAEVMYIKTNRGMIVKSTGDEDMEFIKQI